MEQQNISVKRRLKEIAFLQKIIKFTEVNGNDSSFKLCDKNGLLKLNKKIYNFK